jgi:hypothetical protein
MTTVEIIEPLGSELQTDTFTPAPRPASLEGRRIGLLDNGKPNAAHVIGTAGRALRDRHGVVETVAVTKPVASRPIADEALVRFKGFDAAIVGVGD